METNQPSFYYLLNEYLIEGKDKTLMSSMDFRAPDTYLPNCKRNAEQFYANKKERLDYWVMLGTQDSNEYKRTELCIFLMKHEFGMDTSYLIKSNLVKATQMNLDYEKEVLEKYPYSVFTWREVNSQKQATPQIAPQVNRIYRTENKITVKEKRAPTKTNFLVSLLRKLNHFLQQQGTIPQQNKK